MDYQKMWKGTPLPKVTEKPFELNIGYYRNEDIIFVGVIDELYKYIDKNGNKSIEIGEQNILQTSGHEYSCHEYSEEFILQGSSNDLGYVTSSSKMGLHKKYSRKIPYLVGKI